MLNATTGKEFERVVFAEVVVPDRPNVYGDIYTRTAIREMAYAFMKAGFGMGVGIDINHDNLDKSGSIKVVESFIARAGDTDFVEGAWVLGLYIGDDTVWADILAGRLNGFSYEAYMDTIPITILKTQVGTVAGVTQPDLFDGHQHTFLAVVDSDGRVVSGATDETNGHSHRLSSHTFTDEAAGHRHIYNLIKVG